METVDIARILGDITLLGSFILVISSIIKKKSCAGWSGRMQILLMIAFVTRFARVNERFTCVYNWVPKIVWAVLSVTIVILIYERYNKTYEKRCDTFWIESIILAALASAFIFCDDVNSPEEICWLFSHFVESVTILPQYYFIFQKRKKDLIVTYYIIALIYYRLFYVGHWMNIYLTYHVWDQKIVYPGLVQLVLYAIYFLLPKGKDLPPENHPPPLRNIPTYLTQESLLETPLLKRSGTNTSIYILGEDGTYSTLNRSLSNYSTSSDDRNNRY